MQSIKVSPLKCNLPSQVRRNMILSVLNTVSDPAALSTVGTPQNTAAEWLISEDEEVRCPDDNKLVHRYVMALFYFSTNGDDWTRCNQGDSTCGSVAPFLGQDNYLSGSHECNWAGLTCDAEQCITYIEFGESMRFHSRLVHFSRIYVDSLAIVFSTHFSFLFN